MTTCPKCAFEQPHATECRRCGLVFAKWLEREAATLAEPDELEFDIGPLPEKDTMPADWPSRRSSSTEADTESDANASPVSRFLSRFVEVPVRVPTLRIAGHFIVWIGAVVWGGWFIAQSMQTNRIGASFMHRINLVFHEAGHILFMPFGDFMTVLGGSAMQLIIPSIVAIAFLVKNRDPFGASVGLWWVGQSAKDLAPYINDARLQALPLLGGVTGRDVPGYHDWHNLLARTGMLAWDGTIARSVDISGTLLLVTAMAWGGVILWREWRRHDPDL